MKEATHTRKGRTITTAADGGIMTHKTINQAKRTSRKIQMDADKALGRGSVRIFRRKQSDRAKTGGRQLSAEAIERIRAGR